MEAGGPRDRSAPWSLSPSSAPARGSPTVSPRVRTRIRLMVRDLARKGESGFRGYFQWDTDRGQESKVGGSES